MDLLVSVRGLPALEAVARQRLAGGQSQLELGLDDEALNAVGAGPLRILSSRMAPLWDVLYAAYDQLGFVTAVEGDEVFRALVATNRSALLPTPRSRADRKVTT